MTLQRTFNNQNARSETKRKDQISNLLYKSFLLFLISLAIIGISCSNKNPQEVIIEKKWKKNGKNF